jgi:hypothetical protein
MKNKFVPYNTAIDEIFEDFDDTCSGSCPVCGGQLIKRSPRDSFNSDQFGEMTNFIKFCDEDDCDYGYAEMADAEYAQTRLEAIA